MYKLTIIIFLFFSVTAVRAQNISVGPTAGFGHSWTSTETGGVDKRFHAYYNIGAKIVYSFDSRWGVSGDVLYSGEGTTIGIDADNKNVSRLNYIRVPLQGIYFFGKYGDRIRPKVSLGPSFGFLVGGASRSYDDGNETGKIKAAEIAKGFDLGLSVAGGLNIRIAKSTWLNADLAYYHGLLNVAKVGDAKNRNIGINIGVLLPLGTLKPEKLKGK